MQVKASSWVPWSGIISRRLRDRSPPTVRPDETWPEYDFCAFVSLFPLSSPFRSICAGAHFQCVQVFVNVDKLPSLSHSHRLLISCVWPLFAAKPPVFGPSKQLDIELEMVTIVFAYLDYSHNWRFAITHFSVWEPWLPSVVISDFSITFFSLTRPSLWGERLGLGSPFQFKRPINTSLAWC